MSLLEKNIQILVCTRKKIYRNLNVSCRGSGLQVKTSRRDKLEVINDWEEGDSFWEDVLPGRMIQF